MATIEARNLSKSFPAKGRKRGETVNAVKSINMEVADGEIFGFLGPNGAGKSTTVRMLATLLPPDEGSVRIAGYDLGREPTEVRRRIGYVSQAGGTDRWGTARENLVLQGRLHGLTRPEAATRAQALIERLQMDDFADRRAAGYSGGQRRKVDLALGMIHGPGLLFLDEPTTGLDPVSRAQLWDQIRRLRSAGTTVFLTTHYLDEADQLCDRVAIIDKGEIVAEGSPAALKRELSGDVVTLTASSGKSEDAHRLLEPLSIVSEVITGANGTLRLTVNDGERAVPEILKALGEGEITVSSISLTRPSLDDVFLKLTGHSLEGTAVGPQTRSDSSDAHAPEVYDEVL